MDKTFLILIMRRLAVIMCGERQKRTAEVREVELERRYERPRPSRTAIGTVLHKIRQR